MHKTEFLTKMASDGFLLLDSSLNPIFVNSAAAQILMYPEKVGAYENVEAVFRHKIRPTLLSAQSSCATARFTKFQSGKRMYFCRTFQVNSLADTDALPSVAVLLERASGKPTALLEISDRFGLTTREQQVSMYLLEGLTTKEMAVRMEISPHTVKAYLRLIMVKMGVSTRSAILGKALTAELELR